MDVEEKTRDQIRFLNRLIAGDDFSINDMNRFHEIAGTRFDIEDIQEMNRQFVRAGLRLKVVRDEG